MKAYKKIFTALSAKGVIDVYMYIYYRYTTGKYPSFDDIRVALKMAKGTLRRITNRLSRCDMISSIHPENEQDGRKRVYIVENEGLAEILRQVYTL